MVYKKPFLVLFSIFGRDQFEKETFIHYEDEYDLNGIAKSIEEEPELYSSKPFKKQFIAEVREVECLFEQEGDDQ